MSSTVVQKFIAIVPAAGRGSRLGSPVPKIFTEMSDQRRVFDVIRDNLSTIVEHLHLVLSSEGAELFSPEARRIGSGISISVQATPLGMGDAVYCGLKSCEELAFEHCLVIWGDQVSVSQKTLRAVVEMQSAAGSVPTLTLPLVHVEKPYVQYDFSTDGRLLNVRQSREGDQCDATGFSDIGVFALSMPNLLSAWQGYAAFSALGKVTLEHNFLPFLAHLSSQRGWKVQTLEIDDPSEARGLNTRDDLEYFRNLFGAEGAEANKVSSTKIQ